MVQFCCPVDLVGQRTGSGHPSLHPWGAGRIYHISTLGQSPRLRPGLDNFKYSFMGLLAMLFAFNMWVA